MEALQHTSPIYSLLSLESRLMVEAIKLGHNVTQATIATTPELVAFIQGKGAYMALARAEEDGP